MGSYVLYLLTQAFIALIFAYFSGTLLFKDRRPYMFLVALGFYLLMGAALVEVWGDRAGWETWMVGLNAALVATSVALLGSGALMRESEHMDDPPRTVNLAWVLVVASAVMGAALAVTSGSSSSVVDGEVIEDIEISGAFSHLGPVGWALGAPLLLGAALLIWLGIRGALVRQDLKGFWAVGAGVMFLLWPFNLELAGLPLSPSVMMMGITMAFFGFQIPKEDENDETIEGDGDEEARADKGSDAERRREEVPDEGEGARDEEVGTTSSWVQELKQTHAREGPGEDVDEE
jgi:hypothetical protein